MITELSDNTTLVFSPKPQQCIECSTWTNYGISIDDTPFEARCRKHLPENIIQEYWTSRMLNAALSGNEELARKCLEYVTREARRQGYERCKSIVEVQRKGAKRNYSDEKMQCGAIDMAKRIEHLIEID
jgi:hypothetical protein